MNLADNLKKIRKENNLSQEQLAEKLGVSRQSVSKWESGQAYPEMDKVLQLAKMFNLNIDDLFNQDIKEVNNEKQSKIAINKYIDDFLAFITKTIDMFSSMKWKDRFKCIIEQFIIAFFILILLLIIGEVVSNILYGLIVILPDSVNSIIYSICSSIYSIFAYTLGFILLIHIFKVRYLDYYVIVKEDFSIEEDKTNKIEKEIIQEETKDNKVYLEPKKEKIIIRNPKHTGYRFISGMLKCLLFCVKGLALIIALSFCVSLICFALSLILTFLVIKTGLFFIGLFLSILACIVINLIILMILFSFITNRKIDSKCSIIAFLVSIVCFGIGIGIGIIGFTNFDYIDDINNDIYVEDELTIPMKDYLVIHSHYDFIEYVEEDRNDIRISYKHTNSLTLDMHNYSNYIYLYIINTNNNFLEFSRECIKDINNKKIINYSKFKIYIHTSKENIEKLKNNLDNYMEKLEEENDYYDKLEEQNNEYRNTIYGLEEEIETLKSELELYREQEIKSDY